jgi:aryl-alcohol dehydrogenase-like predicted oxidoreductase
MTLIGTSDLEVFPLALGGNTFGWTSDERESHAVLDAFVAGGGNFIDTADMYSAWVPGNSGGESETIIGSWIARRGTHEDLVIGTKVSAHPQFMGLSAANVVAAADASLARLGVDAIDLYWAHYDDESTPLEETVAAFEGVRTAGKIRHVALSNYSATRVAEWIEIAQARGFALPVALQPHYNLVAREPYESEFGALVDANGLGVVPYFSLAAGFLTGKYRTREDIAGKAREGQVGGYFTDEGLAVVSTLDDISTARGVELATTALAWLQAQPNVVAPIASARTVEQLPALLSAASLTLTPDELAQLDAVSARVPVAA